MSDVTEEELLAPKVSPESPRRPRPSLAHRAWLPRTTGEGLPALLGCSVGTPASEGDRYPGGSNYSPAKTMLDPPNNQMRSG